MNSDAFLSFVAHAVYYSEQALANAVTAVYENSYQLEIIKDFKDIRYFICSSGAVVFDKLTDERISFCFPRDLSQMIFKLLFSVDCHLTVRYFGKMYTDINKMNEECLSNYKV